MTKKLLKVRLTCPVCSNCEHEEIINLPLNDSKIISFQKLEKFYSESFMTEYPTNLSSDFCFKIVKCKNCGFHYNEHILNDMGMSLLYNVWLDQNKLNTYYESKSVDKNEIQRVLFFLKYFENKNKINVLDFGAGYGNFLKQSRNAKNSLYAFDLSDDKNDYMENNLGVTLVRDLEKYENYFHFININQVLEHVAEPLVLLKNLRKCLTEDGILFVSTPNCSGIEQILVNKRFNKKFWNNLSPFQHINAFENKTLKLIAKNVDLAPYNIVKSIKYIRLTKNGVLFFLKQIYHHYLGTSLYLMKNRYKND